MSQMDCLRYLQEQKKQYPEKWHRVKDVQEGLQQKGLSNGVLKGVANDLFQLMRCGDVEWRGVGAWNHYKEFRAKRC